MTQTLRSTIARQRAALSRLLENPLRRLARACGGNWHDNAALDACISGALGTLPHCQLLYAVDTQGIQRSANVSRDGIVAALRGQDLSSRPYLRDAVPVRGCLLSTVYISTVTGRPCITAVQTVEGSNGLLGFVVADFDLRDLPQHVDRDGADDEPAGAAPWRQLKGDPAIRGTLFMQQRVESVLDVHMDVVLAVVEELLAQRGVFHAKLHFSGGRATLWLTDDPYRYQLVAGDELVDPSVCLAYPRRPYPDRAAVAAPLIPVVLERFRALRHADETVYLRTASLNVISGMVRLTFSCDGSHYLPTDDFLRRDLGFWLGR